jgi:hypothetical protein
MAKRGFNVEFLNFSKFSGVKMQFEIRCGNRGSPPKGDLYPNLALLRGGRTVR